MTIVNLYGSQEEINELRAAANGISLEGSFSVPTHGNPVRTNSNADHELTLGRLAQHGVIVSSAIETRELEARLPKYNGAMA